MIHDLPKNLVEDSRKLLQQGADYEKFLALLHSRSLV